MRYLPGDPCARGGFRCLAPPPVPSYHGRHGAPSAQAAVAVAAPARPPSHPAAAAGAGAARRPARRRDGAVRHATSTSARRRRGAPAPRGRAAAGRCRRTRGVGVAGYAVSTLADMPEVPTFSDPGDPAWKPIQHYLGVTAFGINAFIAKAA